MSKIDNEIINNIKMLSLDMIKEAGSGDAGLSLCSAKIFYLLYMKHLIFNKEDNNWFNRDRVLVSNNLLPVFYATNYLFKNNLTLDNLKEFKKFNSNTLGISLKEGIMDAGSIMDGDIISEAIGISLGEKYLEELIKIEDKKSELLNFKTYCICTISDLMSGISYEAMSFASSMSLKNLVFVVINDKSCKNSTVEEVLSENLIDRFISLNFDVDSINDNLSSIDGAIDDAKNSKRPAVVIINTNYKEEKEIELKSNKPLSTESMQELRKKYHLLNPFMVSDDVVKEIHDNLHKRLSKVIKNWQNEKDKCLEDLKLKEIITFLENEEPTFNFKVENIKINDSYEEDLVLSNHKILNIFAHKNPFVICGSDDNFFNTLGNISKSGVMNKENPTGRNIFFGPRTSTMGGVACGLASLGFKVFISTPLINVNLLLPYIRLCTMNSLPVNFIFTQDTFINTYEDMGISPIYELDTLRSIPNLINFRPADVNEILGIYDILAGFHKTSTLIIGSGKVGKLSGTNSKYVLAGAYRVKREVDDVNAILISSGREVEIALELAHDLAPYGIDLRVISMPSLELFAQQNARYQNILLPSGIKTFVLEYNNSSHLHKFSTSSEYVFDINKYSFGGSKEELLNFYELDLDSIKAKIIELMKK